jgi:MFS family permease
MKVKTTLKGDLRLLFNRKGNLRKYISICILGFPVWFSQGVIMTFTPEIGKAWGMDPVPAVSTVFTFYFIGLALGDLSGGFISQYFKSRKKVIKIYLLIFVLGFIAFFTFGNRSATTYYSLMMVIGFAVGYSIVLLTLAAEQFGTNMRATVTTSSLNMIRATAIPQTLLFEWLIPYLGAVQAAAVVFVIAVLIAIWGLSNLDETFNKELNFVEE